MATGISDAALLRALAEDVPDMALTVREHLREIADHLESDRAANSLATPDVNEIVREVMMAYPYANYQYVAQNAVVERSRADRHARSVAQCVGRRVVAALATGKDQQ